MWCASSLPPLIDRREDIPLLVSHFLRQLNAEHGKRVESISAEAMSELMRHSFPGNVRELQNIVERAVVLCRGTQIELENLPPELLDASPLQAGSSTAPQSPLSESEAATILHALRQQGGHRGKGGRPLGHRQEHALAQDEKTPDLVPLRLPPMASARPRHGP